MPDEQQDRRSGEERREEAKPSEWARPQFLVQMAVIVFGIWFGLQAKTSELDKNAALMQQTATEMKSTTGEIKESQRHIADSVQILTNITTTLSSKDEQHQRDIQELKTKQDNFAAYVTDIEKQLAAIRTDQTNMRNERIKR